MDIFVLNIYIDVSCCTCLNLQELCNAVLIGRGNTSSFRSCPIAWVVVQPLNSHSVTNVKRQ